LLLIATLLAFDPDHITLARLRRKTVRKNARAVGRQRNRQTARIPRDDRTVDEVLPLEARARCELRIAQSVDLPPRNLYLTGGGIEVEEGKNDRAVARSRQPDLLLLLAQGLDIDRTGRYARLVDPDDLSIADQGQVAGVHLRQVRTKIERRTGDGPKQEHALPFVNGQPVSISVAQFERVQIVPSSGRGIGNPSHNVLEALRHLGPLGKVPPGRILGVIASVALDVVLDAPAVGGGAPERSLIERQIVGKLKPDGPGGVRQRSVPLTHLFPVVRGQVATARTHEIHLDEVHSPGFVLVDLRANVGSSGRFGEVDLIAVTARVAGKRYVRDIRNVAGGSGNPGILLV
jgi:hypothetical protein